MNYFHFYNFEQFKNLLCGYADIFLEKCIYFFVLLSWCVFYISLINKDVKLRIGYRIFIEIGEKFWE